MSETRRAVVLLSGGLDSAVVLRLAQDEGYRCHALTIDYGQRHAVEIQAARVVARSLGAVEHRVVRVDLRMLVLGESALTTHDAPLPSGRTRAEIARDEAPCTYVPGRNTVFLAVALAWAESLGASTLFLGCSAPDQAGYPDCRPGFLRAFEYLAALATRAGSGGGRFSVQAPLLPLDKPAIRRLAATLGIDPGMTWSCYDPIPDSPPRPCGVCDACVLRGGE